MKVRSNVMRKNELRRTQSRTYLLIKTANVVRDVHKNTTGIPEWLRGVMLDLAMMRATSMATRIPVKIFRADKPEIDKRRSKRWRSRLRRRHEREKDMQVVFVNQRKT